MGAIMIYDLRKSSKEVYKVCCGHKHTINSLKFANKISPKTKQDQNAPIMTTKEVKGDAAKER